MESKEILNLAKEIRDNGSLHTVDSAIIEAKRILEQKEKFKQVDSYYANRFKG